LLARSDEHNNFAAEKAEKDLKKVKRQKTQDKETYERRRLQVEEKGATAQLRNKNEHEGNLVYWQLKAEGLQDKMKTMKVHPNPTRLIHLILTTTFTLNLALTLLTPTLTQTWQADYLGKHKEEIGKLNTSHEVKEVCLYRNPIPKPNPP
jgi:hypothetical protein